LEREEFRDLGVRDEAELARIKAEVSSSSWLKKPSTRSPVSLTGCRAVPCTTRRPWRR